MSSDGDFMNASQLNGLTAYDRDGDKIGTIGQVYLDDATGRPEWVTVKTGLFGMKESLVPLSGASRVGEDLHIPFGKESVKGAPRLDAGEHLSPGQEKQLYQHYGLVRTGPGTAMGRGADGGRDTTGRDATATGRATTGRDTTADRDTGMRTGTDSGARTTTGMTEDPTAGAGRPQAAAAGMRGAETAGEPHRSEEFIRSEEQLHIGTEEQEVGRARLRKVVVTENVTTSVPLSHEEVRVIHEPIAAGDRSADGASIEEAQTEVVLHAEQPVVRKETVAVERVRLETERVTEQQEISSDVRKEQIEYDPGRSERGRGDARSGKHGRGH